MEPGSNIPISPIPTAGTAIPAIVDVVADTATSIYNTNQTIKANKKMAEYGYSKDLDMWRLQNEYNSPASQMQRYKEAGLNPLLIYGGGSASSGNATNLPRYQVPKLDYSYSFRPNIVDNIQKYQDIAIRQGQQNLLEEEIRRKKADADYAKLKVDEYSWKLPWIKNFSSFDYLSKQQKYSLLGEQVQKTSVDWKTKSDLYDLTKKKLEAEIRGIEIKNRWSNLGLNNPSNMILGLASSLLLGRGFGSALGRAASGIGKSKITGGKINPGVLYKKNYDLKPNLNW